MPARRTTALLMFALFAALYLYTMCPTIYTMDNGELIVAAYKLELAHPTGYPLFCLLGKLSTYAIPFGSVAERINAMNALLAAAAVSVLFLALSEVSRRKAAAFTAALFGISPLFWDTATYAEVHALSVLLLTTELLLFLRWRRMRETRLLYWLAAVVGLSLTNHMTTALVVPGLLYGIFRTEPSLLRDRRFLARAVLCGILPLALYAYLPLRAAASRGMIWGDVYAAMGFRAHVTGKLFSGRMFTSPPWLVWQHVQLFGRLLLEQFPIHLAWALPIGAVLIKRRRRRLVGALGILIALNVFYAVNYQIPDIETYYFPTFLALSVCLAVGLNWVLERPRSAAARALMAAALPALLIVGAIGTFPRANKRDATYIMDYAQNVLKTVEKNSVLIACGDSSYNALLYAREVDGQRPDIIVFDRNMLRLWLKNDPNYTARFLYESVSERSRAMRRFRWPSPYKRYDMNYERFLGDIIAQVVRERPVYLNCTGGKNQEHPVLNELKGRCKLLPEGLVYRIVPESLAVDKVAFARHSEELWRSYETRRIFNDSIEGGDLERDIPNRYASLLTKLGDLELQAGMFREAAHSFSSALRIEDDLLRARVGLGVAFACCGERRLAAKELRTVLVTQPQNAVAMRALRAVAPTD